MATSEIRIGRALGRHHPAETFFGRKHTYGGGETDNKVRHPPEKPNDERYVILVSEDIWPIYRRAHTRSDNSANYIATSIP